MNNKFKLYLLKLIDVIKKRQIRKLFQYWLSLLSKFGVEVTPYYLTIESMPDNFDIKPSSNVEFVVCDFLVRREFEYIYNQPETKWMSSIEKSFRNDDCLCFALIQDQVVLTFMWCNLHRCNSDLSSFLLKHNEAYLFNAYTYIKYRGMNLAPYLRYEVYKALLERGRDKLFSETEYFNASALAFKKKLGARHVKLSFYVKLFSKIKWNITIKKYGQI